ncbi:replication protein [Anaerotignum sp.]
MGNNKQSKYWLLTINNPDHHSITEESIIETLNLFQLEYWCYGKEISETGTPHFHIFMVLKTSSRFSTIKRRFPTAHIEDSKGMPAENRNYVSKEGEKWKEKREKTFIEGSFKEWGILPEGREKKPSKMVQLLEDIKEGLSTQEIIEAMPAFAFKVRDIDILRETYLAEKYQTEEREVSITYLYGATGTGKTRSIYDKHPAAEICRITNYSKNGVRFDAYHGHDVLVFEEFNSQIPIEEMLNILDRYALMLPARYSDRVACFTTVYITSNIPLEKQYVSVQCDRPETWKALLRRINHVFEYLEDGTVIERTDEYEQK